MLHSYFFDGNAHFESRANDAREHYAAAAALDADGGAAARTLDSVIIGLYEGSTSQLEFAETAAVTEVGMVAVLLPVVEVDQV